MAQYLHGELFQVIHCSFAFYHVPQCLKNISDKNPENAMCILLYLLCNCNIRYVKYIARFNIKFVYVKCCVYT